MLAGCVVWLQDVADSGHEFSGIFYFIWEHLPENGACTKFRYSRDAAAKKHLKFKPMWL